MKSSAQAITARPAADRQARVLRVAFGDHPASVRFAFLDDRADAIAVRCGGNEDTHQLEQTGTHISSLPYPRFRSFLHPRHGRRRKISV